MVIIWIMFLVLCVMAFSYATKMYIPMLEAKYFFGLFLDFFRYIYNT